MATGLMIRRDLKDRLPWEMGEFTLSQTFNNDASRDTYYHTHSTELINSGGEHTYIASAGKFQMWKGANKPATYDNTQWEEVSAFMEGKQGPLGPQGTAGPAGPEGPQGPEGQPGDIDNLFDSSAKEGDVLTINAAKRLVPTGVTAKEGSLTIATNTLNLGGAHSMSSGGENVFFRNLATNKDYHPLWIETAETGVPQGTVRLYTDTVISSVTYGSPTDTIFTNPSKTLVGSADRRIWSVEILPAENMTNVSLEVKQGGEVVWDYLLGDMIANQPFTVDFKGKTAPIDNKLGEPFNVRFYSPDGDVKLKGSNAAQLPYLAFFQRKWEDVVVLTANDKIKDVTVDADKSFTVNYEGGVTQRTDVSKWFNGGHQPPTSSESIWYGFNANKPPTSGEVKAGTRQDVRSISGLDVTASRPSASAAEYVFIWVPDSLGAITHIDIGGLHDVWQATPVTIDSVAGKAYVSDNATFATNYRFQIGTAYVY